LNIPDAEDILTFIAGMPSTAEREAALAVVEEEEMRGFLDIQLQEGAEEVVAWLREEKGMQVALATRNNAKCVEKLVELCAFHPPAISSSLHDLSLNPSLLATPFSSSLSLASPGSFHPILTRVFKSEVDVDKLLAVSEQWGLPPSSILVVGDSLGTFEGGRERGDEGRRERHRQTMCYFWRDGHLYVHVSVPYSTSSIQYGRSMPYPLSSLPLTPLSHERRGLSMGTYGRHEVLPDSYRRIPHG
jgi:phosphoglycolate phosphatase-like HAD superfamily hydrolase